MSSSDIQVRGYLPGGAAAGGASPLLQGAGIGAALGAALPAGALADYELRQLPGHRRAIDRLINEAEQRKRIFVTDAAGNSGLGKHMRLGDAMAISHKPTNNLSAILRKPSIFDMADAAFLGTGSSFPHIETVAGAGRAVDTGIDGAKTPFTRLGKSLKSMLEERKLKRIELKNLFDPNPAVSSNLRKALQDASYDTFKYMETMDSPYISVVNRLGDFSQNERDKMIRSLATKQKTPYSNTRAAAAGLLRLLVPGGDKLAQVPLGSLGAKIDQAADAFGSFCADGVCSTVRPTSARTGAASLAMPTDFLKKPLVGINMNRQTLDLADEGLKGSKQLASAARNSMMGTLRSSANMRRAAGAGLVGILGTLGLGAGAAAGAISDGMSGR